MNSDLKYATNLISKYKSFVSNNTEYMKLLSTADTKKLCEYKGTLAYDVNTCLRNESIDRINMEHRLYTKFRNSTNADEKAEMLQKYIKYVKKYTTFLTSLFERSPRLSKDTTVYRIINNDSGFLPIPGKSINLPGFTSCSIDVMQSLYYFGGMMSIDRSESNIVLLQITVKAKTPYIFIDDHCFRNRDLLSRQGEILFPSNMKLHMVKRLAKLGEIDVYKATLNSE